MRNCSCTDRGSLAWFSVIEPNAVLVTLVFGLAPLHHVRGVEHLGPQLEIDPAVEADVLEEREVHVERLVLHDAFEPSTRRVEGVLGADLESRLFAGAGTRSAARRLVVRVQVLNHRAVVGLLSTGSPIRSTLSGMPTGTPDRKNVTVLIIHPPRMCRIAQFRVENDGVVQPPLRRSTWGRCMLVSCS